MYTLFIPTLALLSLTSAFTPPPPLTGQQHHFSPTKVTGGKERVNVTLYVMSRCPDARICEGVFEEVFKTPGIMDKVNFDLGFIAKPNKTSEYGLQCKHGPLECIGNAHEACLLHYLPLDKFYPILSCLDYQSPFPGDIGKVELTKRCVEVGGVDYWASGVGRCISGPGLQTENAEWPMAEKEDDDGRLSKEARKLLWKSVKRTLKRGVERSCTIWIDSTISHQGKRVCQVDGGVWSGCDDGHTASDFVRVIEEEYKSLTKK